MNLCFKGGILLAILLLFFKEAAFSQSVRVVSSNEHPVYPPNESDVATLIAEVTPVLEMNMDEIINFVPTKSGFFFIGCPNCHGGAQNMNVLDWNFGMGDKLKCNYCGMTFPNDKYPANNKKVIISPRGAKQSYNFYEDSTGQYFYEAHLWYEKWNWIRPIAKKMALLWYLTKDDKYGDRAAAIIGRFAQVFPDYAVRYDERLRKKFFPADQKWPYKGISPYRGAKWNWWAYKDIPVLLAEAYDLLLSGYDWERMKGVIAPNVRQLIEEDLLQLGYKYTSANPEAYSNMSPGLYTDMIKVGRILKDTSMIHDGINRFQSFFSKGFFADGWWREGSPSYHDMTVNNLMKVKEALAGFSEEETEDKDYGRPYFDPSLLFTKAIGIKNTNILPDGRKIPINDTWPYSGKMNPTDTTMSRLWPNLGNAILGSGSFNNQIAVNVNWSGNYGHAHRDNGSMILYAFGHELFSDIGYTHTKYRGWASSSASHNTVVIDEKNQGTGTSPVSFEGSLLFYDDHNPHIKVLDVDASAAYPIADIYRRRVVLVDVAPGMNYVVDRFDVKGGKIHDWFLHGMCEQLGELETEIPFFEPVVGPIPSWGQTKKPKTQYDSDENIFHPYGFLKEVRKSHIATPQTVTWQYDSLGIRSHLLISDETEFYKFKSPSVRLANENNNKLDDFDRNGIFLRHLGDSSSFIAVHEPFLKKKWIKQIEREKDRIIVHYDLDDRERRDSITFHNDEIIVHSSGGWNYFSGKPLSGEIQSLIFDDHKWNLILDKPVSKADFIRIEFPDKRTYYGAVRNIEANVLEMTNDPGFRIEPDGKVEFYTFPQRDYEAPLHYTVFSKE